MPLPKTLADLSKALRARTTLMPSNKTNYNGDFISENVADPLTTQAADALDRMTKALEPFAAFWTRKPSFAEIWAAQDAIGFTGEWPEPTEPSLPMNAELFGAIWDVLNGSPAAFPAPSEETAFERKARKRLLSLMPGPEAFPGMVDRASYDLAQAKAAKSDTSSAIRVIRDGDTYGAYRENAAYFVGRGRSYSEAVHALLAQEAGKPPAPPPSSVAQSDWDDAMASRGKVQGGIFVPGGESRKTARIKSFYDSEAPKAESPTLRGLDEQKPLDRLVFESDLRAIVAALREEARIGAPIVADKIIYRIARALESGLKRKS